LFQLSLGLIREPSIASAHETDMLTQKRKFAILSAYPLTERVSFGDKAFNRTYGAQSPALDVRVGKLSIGLITLFFCQVAHLMKSPQKGRRQRLDRLSRN
jgi:hypothetical protein